MANIIKLNTGKAIGAFPGLVETFNWLVDFCQNLKGSGEESSEDGNGIVVDRSVPGHPVIRGGGGAKIEIDIPLDGVLRTYPIVVEQRYDLATHSLQQKCRYLKVEESGASKYVTGITVADDWTTITNGAADPLYAS